MVWEIAVILGAAALAVLLVWLLYSATFRAFEAVGFTRPQATALILGTFLLSFVDLPLFYANGWLMMVNVGGALVPLLVSLWLLRQRPSATIESLVAVFLTAIVAYLVVDVTPQGITAPIGAALLPPLVAAGVSLLAHWRSEAYAAPIAFIGGALGSLLGADVLHLLDFVAQSPPQPGTPVSIGGAGVWDMVFLSAIVAVGLDVLFFRRLRREHAERLPWMETEVFTTATPPEVIRDWTAPQRAPPAAPDERATRLRAAAEERRQAARQAAAQKVRSLSGQEIPQGRR